MTEWRPIPGWVGLYEVSDDGAVRNVNTGHILAASLSNGYPAVHLSRSGRAHPKRVHRLVALAFLGEPGPGLEVRHLDGNRTNNVSSNLAWGTRSENIQDCVIHGTHARANSTVTICVAGHSLTPETVWLIGGRRICKKCQVRRQREYRARKRATSAVIV